MKKAFVLFLTLVMILTMNVTALAAGGFVSSPSNNQAPVLVEGKNQDTSCSSKLVLISFSDRNKLSEENRDNLEKAYDAISKTDDISKLNSELAEVVANMGILGTDLAVSDIFNIDHTDCVDHSKHGAFEVKLRVDNIKNFFALLQFDGTVWKHVKNARFENGYLIFTTNDPSNFAIVVNKNETGNSEGSSSDEITSPQTGDNNRVYFWAAILVGSALALVVLNLKKKKI